MKYTEFKQQTDDGKCRAVYLFEGEDAFFRESGLKLLKNKFVEEPSLNFVSFNGDVGVGELLPSLEGFPFMSEKRMTLVRDFYPKADYFKNGLKSYLENPNPSAILVILNEKEHAPLKKFENVCVVECSKADTIVIVKWIKRECTLANVTIDGESANLLAEYCLFDMTRIQTEVQKLISYAGDGGSIDKKVVEDMVARETEYKVYEMTDCIAKKQFDKALSIITDMLSKGETVQFIIACVYGYFRRLLHASISDMTAQEFAEAFGAKEFVVRKTIEQAKKFKKRSLKNAVDALIDADYKIKSGQADADEKMWLTVFKIMTDN